ncbi:MAG: hypothetical protein J5746_13545 [Victivallales bacterium]|nr:hypothetical protein [Victivallales bacterium]
MKIDDILHRFSGVTQTGRDSWKCTCPVHNDSNASLSISEKQGKILMNCLAGCPIEAVLNAVGLQMKDLFLDEKPKAHGGNYAYGCTMAQYAQAKCFDLEKLKSFGLSDGERLSNRGTKSPGVRIPYWNSRNAMEPCGVRWRMRMQKEQGNEPSRFLWERDSRLCLYGIWRKDDAQRDVILVEGESDCHSLWSVDYTDADGVRCFFNALGFPGASNYRPDRDDQELQFYDTIYVHIEKDTGGHTLFTRLTGTDGKHSPSSLLPKMKFFSLAGYKDPSDAWVRMHTTTLPKEEQDREFYRFIHVAVLNAQPWHAFVQPDCWKSLEQRQDAQPAEPAKGKTPKTGATQQQGRGGRPATDYAGMVDAFRRLYFTAPDGCLTLRYWRNAWYLYNGKCYRQMLDADMENTAMTFLLNPQTTEQFHCQPSANALRTMLLGLRSTMHCGIPAQAEMPLWLSSGETASGWRAMGNCLIDVETAATYHYIALTENRKPTPDEVAKYTRPLTPDLLSTFSMDYAYDAEADCPHFKAWLASTLPDPALQRCVQQMLGLLLVPDTSYNICFFCYGDGGTGKSTFADILRAVICEGNVCRFPLLKFDDKFSTWVLAESLVDIVGEMPTEDPQGKLRSIEGDFKDAVSGGTLTIEKKGKDITFAKCTARFVFCCNTLPIFFDKSEGIWDRLIIIPFEQRFRGSASEVRDIKATIIPDELPGIFNFALAGLADLRGFTRFPEPAACEAAKQYHRDRCDFDGTFLRENFSVKEGTETPVSYAYEKYKAELLANGLATRSSPTFQQAVARIFGLRPVKRSSNDATRVWRNLNYNPPYVDPSPYAPKQGGDDHAADSK